MADTFEPTGLLGFGDDIEMESEEQVVASPPKPAPAGAPAPAPRPLRNDMPSYSPPPFDMDEEPSDFEDDVQAMMDEEAAASVARDLRSLEPTAEEKKKQEEAARRRRAAIMAATQPQQTQQPTPPTTRKTSGVSSAASGSDSQLPEFMLNPDLGFDFRPVASSSRTRTELTPPPDLVVDDAEVFDEVGRHLPRLRATTASGGVVMFRRKLRQRAAEEEIRDDIQLLSKPLHKLKAEVEEMRSREKAMELEREFEAETQPANGKAPAMTMWVDKYRPKKFSDLLGEDRVHREVMNWLKEWDKCVFKRQPLKKRKQEEEGFVYDPLGRPRDRVLLLSGPPGYGKTTLAHIVAKHAGYATLEINASDDRNAATVSSRIKNAIDAGSGLASDGKPTCVIIDEIDGASGGGDTSFVRSLIKLIQDVPARKKSNTPARPLRRPIICICNDLYAPALRPLRPFAHVVRFRKPASQFLVARLREICDRERLTADLRVLTALVDLTGGDVRSCLNTLQFIQSKSPVVTHEAIKSSSVGTKDTGTTLQSAWDSLFVPMAAKQRRKQLGIDDGRYVDRLAFMVQACGEHERLVQGLFEHYPNVKPLDASLANVCRLHDWIAYYDCLSGKIASNMEFELLAYVPYAIVPWHTHMGAPGNATRPAEWPKADYESFQTRVANEEIATSLKTSIPPILHSLFTSSTSLTELIPLLMRIISPPLKPVNANIVKPAERAVLARLVELMIPLGLQFWQEKAEDGQPMMRLEPAIDVFVHYDGKRAGDIAASRFAVRQLVAQAMDSEMARRRGQAGADSDASNTAAMLAQQYGVAKTGRKDAAAESLGPSTDFFGRVKAPAIVEDPDAPSVPTQFVFRAVYKFNEGSSSAVRKNVKMSALM